MVGGARERVQMCPWCLVTRTNALTHEKAGHYKQVQLLYISR